MFVYVQFLHLLLPINSMRLTVVGLDLKAFDMSKKEECKLKGIEAAPGKSVCIKILSI